MAPRSHTRVNRLGWRAKPGEGSRSGLKPSGEPDRVCLPKHAKCGPGGVSGRKRFSSNGHEGGYSKWCRAQRARQGTTDAVAIHCSQGSPSHDGSPYHWILASASGSWLLWPRGWDRPCAPSLPLYKPFPHRFIFGVHSQKPCSEGRGARGEVATGSCYLKPTRRRPGCVNRSFSDRMTEEIRCSTGRLSSPFQGSTVHPHMRGGAIKGAIKKAHPEIKTG